MDPILSNTTFVLGVNVLTANKALESTSCYSYDEALLFVIRRVASLNSSIKFGASLELF